MSYQLGDFIIRLKNACMARRRTVIFPYSKINIAIGQLLTREGFLENITEEEAEGNKVLVKDTKSWTGFDSLTSMIINDQKQRVDRVGSGRWIDAGEPITMVILEWVNPVEGPLVKEGEACNLQLYP